MSLVAWIILLVLVIPMLGILIWVVITESLVRVPSGSLGLLMVKGKATDTTLLPGSHFVPALRRRMVEEYPSVELAYRAGAQDDDRQRPDLVGPLKGSGPQQRSRDLERSGPPLQVTLGDRTTATISLTVRFQLIPEQLRLVHEQFGPQGFYGIVRDETTRSVHITLGDPAIGIDSLFGPARQSCEQQLAAAVGEALLRDGIRVTALLLGTVDLGRTGEVIAATARARLELDREKAEAATRLARALNDADLQQKITTSGETAWRYRETDLWRDLVERTEALQVALRAGPAGTAVGLTARDDLTNIDGTAPGSTS
jgi:hypothetical protein